MSPTTLFRALAAPLLIHNHNMDAAMIRAGQAKAQGLSEGFGIPLPGSSSTTTNNISQATGWLKGAILGATLLAGGAGAAGVAMNALKPAASAVVTPDPIPPVVTPVKDPAFDEITEQQQSDGSWKQIGKARHLDRQPDGTYR